MQLKRSYSRRLKFEIIIYEYNFITRRAYKSIKLAVKTSRPQYFKDTFFGVTTGVGLSAVALCEELQQMPQSLTRANLR